MHGDSSLGSSSSTSSDSDPLNFCTEVEIKHSWGGAPRYRPGFSFLARGQLRAVKFNHSCLVFHVGLVLLKEMRGFTL